MHMCVVPEEAGRGYLTLWSWNNRQLSANCYECWEPNLGPLEEQQMTLTPNS